MKLLNQNDYKIVLSPPCGMETEVQSPPREGKHPVLSPPCGMETRTKTPTILLGKGDSSEPTVWDGDFKVSSTSTSKALCCSEPTVWDGDPLSHTVIGGNSCVLSPLGGMETSTAYSTLPNFALPPSGFKPTGWDGDLTLTY